MAPEITQHIWGFTPEGEAVVLYTMTNAGGASVGLTNIGAAITSISVPDRDGRLADVALGYEAFDSYFNDGPAMGKIVGRYGNRIANGAFTLDGTEYRLARNNGPNHLHGGPRGFGNRIWASRVETDRVVFSLTSPDGDERYPGELGCEVVYDWDDDCRLEITLFARSDAPTIVNLTNHAYFNLAGEGSGTVLGHTLQLNASHYLATDPTLIPTGALVPVAGTPLDFTAAKPLGRDIDTDCEALRYGNGYDQCFAVDGWQPGQVAEVGTLADPVSGRRMTILSSQPGLQLYTGNYLQGCPSGKHGHDYRNRDGVALECQGFPDAPNHPDFPSQVLRPGETYVQKIVYRFDTTDPA
ncbi:MAG: galactose mutarotase [Rikenellaceae bacterium]|nr:galactose mutarotase [Rikenellaceae bacterium]